ncbi:MAG: carboxypeptidase regulatory-like domain-containing protein [Elusimicrobia bacterium]|nr:carboxypeptidase regulatory-like domain-containing protein [Elusimicrobiota bacterium]
MSAPAKCPGCGTKLLPDWESCPNCPLSFRDAPPEKTAFQSDTFRNIIMPILLFGGLGYGIWAMASFFWSTTEQTTRGAVTTVQKAARSVSLAPTGGGVVPVNSEAIQGIVNEQVTGVYDPKGRVKYVRKVNPDEEGGGVVSIMPEAAAKEKIVREWKMRGHVYDLVTLRPVAGAKLIFTDNETNSQAFLVSDSAGLYRTILPPLRGHGYLVAISKAGYAKTYLNPGTEGVSEMPLERRKELVAELATTISEPASLEPNSETPLVTDFHLAPK